MKVSIPITSDILKFIAQIDEFRGQWNTIRYLSRDRLHSLRKTATIESIGSSTRIEGAKLSDKEVEELLQPVQKKSFKSRDEEEVAGYAEAMHLVFDSWNELSLSENHIKQMHTILLQYSSKDQRHRGEYKTLDNHVAAFDTKGNQIGIVFQTTSPFDTPRAMKRLVNWFNEENELHPLLKIGVFIVEFLAIHPFQDGNGRLSRILTTLLLLKNEYNYVPYVSLESIIEENKENYYQALRKTQRTLDKKPQNWTPWLLFFLKSLIAQKDVLAKKIQVEEIQLTTLSLLSTQLLELLRDRGRITVSEAVNTLKANRNTVKKRLKELVEKKLLVLHGAGRGAYYTLK